MPDKETNGFVPFRHVRIISAAASALFCAIADKRVWLPREHVKGRLWSRGDRGTLLVRRWIALDRQLIAPRGTTVVPIAGPGRRSGELHVMRRPAEAR